MSSIAEAAPAAKASTRSCREASASTNSRRAAGLVVDTLAGHYKSDLDHLRDVLERLAHEKGRRGVRQCRDFMRTQVHTGQFRRDTRRTQRQGTDMSKLRDVVSLLIAAGMFTVIRIREGLAANDYKDPGPYDHPKGTVAYEFTI